MSTQTLTTIPTSGKKPRVRMERVNWSGTIILILCAVTVLLPLYVTISMAFKTTGQAVDGNAFSLPAPFSIDGFVEAWNLTKFPVGAAISLLVTAGTVIATILLAAFASYAIVRNWDRRLFRYSFFYLLAAMFIPFPVVALPQIQLTGRVGLDNPLGVIILATMFQLSFSVLLFTAFLRSIPIELEESARIDGATTWQTFWQLIFPLLAPMSATVGIFAFLYAWNDFMMPSLIISDPALQTLPVRQNLFQTQFSNNYNVSFASFGDRSELRVVLDLHDGSPVAQCVGEAGVRPLPETVGMRWRDAVAVHGGGDAGAQCEHAVSRDAGLVECRTQLLEDHRPALVGRLVRGDLHPVMHERPVDRIRDGHGEVRVAGVDADDDAEVGGEGETPCGAPGAVAPGGAGIGEFVQHVGADQGVDRIDRGGTGERGAGHDVAGGEVAGIPGEVEHGADARASGSETSRDFCHTP